MYKEDDWKKFAKYYVNDKSISRKNNKKLLEKLNNDKVLVSVIEGVVGETAIDWIERKIPALNNGKPINFVKDSKKLEKLKSILMEMTCWC